MLENEIVHGSHTFDKVNYLFVSVNTNTGIYRIDKDRSSHFHGKQYLSEGKVIEALNDLKKVMVTNKTKSTIITSNFDPYKIENSTETFGSVIDKFKNNIEEQQLTLVTIYLSQNNFNNYMLGEEVKGYFQPRRNHEVEVHIPTKELKTLTQEIYEPDCATIQGRKIY
jgi:hypothetical protein